MGKNVLRSGVAAAAVLGAAVVGAGLWAGTASAMPNEGCRASQLTTTVVHGEPGAGQRYAEVQFTAKPGQYCQLKGSLPVSLAGAPGVNVVADTPSDSAPETVVHLRPGQSAHLQLHWTGIEENQVTPSSITITAPGDYGPQQITLPWNEGSLDAGTDAHTLNVGMIQAGPAVDE
jgi:hypothetical protein